MSTTNRKCSVVFAMVCTVAVFSGLAGCTKAKDAGKREVNLAIWSNYLRSEEIAKFEKETGIKVNVSNYASNEELLAKVQAGASGIDVAVPSDYMVAIMAKSGLLEKLDREKLPNATQVSPELLKQEFDPENTYSLPYSWATAGIAVNREVFKGTIKGWKDIFENPQLAGKFSLLDDVREVTAAALKFHGYSVNTTKTDELKKAEQTLLKVKSKVKMFNSDTLDALVKKEVAVAHSYSTDALQAAAQSGGKIEYILPEEGGTRSIDNLVVLKGAKNRDAAFQLINFMLSVDVNVNFVQTMWGGPVLSDTRNRLPETVKNNSALFPPAAKMQKFEALVDVGDNTRLYDELWTRVKTE